MSIVNVFKTIHYYINSGKYLIYLMKINHQIIKSYYLNLNWMKTFLAKFPDLKVYIQFHAYRKVSFKKDF